MDQVLEITSNDHIIMFDKLCKRILGHPETLGRITKGFVKEAKDVSLEEIIEIFKERKIRKEIIIFNNSIMLLIYLIIEK